MRGERRDNNEKVRVRDLEATLPGIKEAGFVDDHGYNANFVNESTCGFES